MERWSLPPAGTGSAAGYALNSLTSLLQKGGSQPKRNILTLQGDISNLPFIETEPATPAFIRNCTKAIMWVLPDDVQLLDKFEAPFNEEQFNVGLHRVIDPNNPDVSLKEIDLSEGERVDILYDGAGEKSKCE